jgi:Family of unknown function (DUF6527)
MRVNIARWWRDTWSRIGPRRRLLVVEGDSLPARMPARDLVLARDNGEDWCVGLRCPCGCGDTLELLVVAEARPRWDVAIDEDGWPSLVPSVWRKKGCRSHFWIRRGRAHWCSTA